MPELMKVGTWRGKFLEYCGLGICATMCLHTSVQAAAQGNVNTDYRVIGVAKGRLNIPPLSQPLKLEEPNEIPVRVHGDYEIHSVSLSLDYTDTTYSHYFERADMEVTLMHHQDGSAYVSLTPENLGHVRIHLQVEFEDGFMEVAHFDTAEVVLPDRKPEKLYVDDPRVGTIHLDLSGRSKGAMLRPKAVYKGALHPVIIPPEFLTFKVIADNQTNPPVSVDATGMVLAQNQGHALVETTFGDLSTLTCVTVREDAGPGPRTNCDGLVPPGMTPPKTGVEDVPAQMLERLTRPRVQIPPPEIQTAPQ